MKLFFTIACLTVAMGVNGNAIQIPQIIDHHPRYAFNYAVNDPHTGDNKAQWESRDGGAVKGSYSLAEPDGTLRVVDYSADDVHGFNADVKRIGPGLHPAPKHALNSVVHAPLQVPILPAPILRVPAIHPIIPSINYGFGAAPLAIGLPRPATLPYNLPWDPITHSYGGWVPLPHMPIGPHATIISKKYINGRLHQRIIGPISLVGQKLIVRTIKH